MKTNLVARNGVNNAYPLAVLGTSNLNSIGQSAGVGFELLEEN